MYHKWQNVCYDIIHNIVWREELRRKKILSSQMGFKPIAFDPHTSWMDALITELLRTLAASNGQLWVM